jgi:deoxyribonuclease-4
MPTAGGVHRAVDHARTAGATALQVFVKSARQWASRPLAPDEVEAFRDGIVREDLSAHVLAHGTYLVNLASPDDLVWRRSIDTLAAELERCRTLGIPSLVLHPGSHMGMGEAAGLARVVRAIDRALGRGAGPALLLEITAGQGTCLGHRFEQLGWVLARVRRPERVGVCFDTCHAHAAGYDLRDRRSYLATFRAFDRAIGLARLRAFHLNDSKAPLGSRRDRHEHIGRGTLGLAPFRHLLNDRRFRGVPMVLETPKGKDLAEDVRNLGVLRSLVSERRR